MYDMLQASAFHPSFLIEEANDARKIGTFISGIVYFNAKIRMRSLFEMYVLNYNFDGTKELQNLKILPVIDHKFFVTCLDYINTFNEPN